MEKQRLDELISHLPDNATILDVGCGTGKPILEYLLSKGFNVTGLDASEEILKIARANFPQTAFILQDMRELELDQQFDAIIAWHSFFHLPEEDQPQVLERFAKHLKLNGLLLFTSGPKRGEAWGMNGGENLFHASLNLEEYKIILQENGFKILKHNTDDVTSGSDTNWLVQLI